MGVTSTGHQPKCPTSFGLPSLLSARHAMPLPVLPIRVPAPPLPTLRLRLCYVCFSRRRRRRRPRQDEGDCNSCRSLGLGTSYCECSIMLLTSRKTIGFGYSNSKACRLRPYQHQGGFAWLGSSLYINAAVIIDSTVPSRGASCKSTELAVCSGIWALAA